MKLTIEINMDNAAFHEDHNSQEVFRVLDRLRSRHNFEQWEPGDAWTLYDTNGNDVGSARVNSTNG